MEGTVVGDNKHFWDTQWFLWFSLIFIFPVGLALLWFNTECEKSLKIKMSIGFGLLFLIAMFSGHNGDKQKTEPVKPQQEQVQQVTQKAEQPKQEASKPATPEDKIKDRVKQYVKDYNKTDINDITVNPDLGTEKDGDYVVLVRLTWNEMNSGETSQKMLEMYSSDMAARMYNDLPEVQELAVFWTVPYINGQAKVSFERTNGGMAFTDQAYDNNFRK